MNIHIVMGKTGEYDDRRQWSVIAYFDEAKTKEYVSKANRRAKEIFDKQGNIFAIPSGQNEFDPNMKMSYTGTNYFYYTVPIADKI